MYTEDLDECKRKAFVVVIVAVMLLIVRNRIRGMDFVRLLKNS